MFKKFKSKPVSKQPKKYSGFTLIELAVVMVIVGIITAGAFAGLSAMREASKFTEDQRKLADIKSALLRFVAVNHYLPCPDTSGDGSEDRLGSSCSATSGDLPYLDLGTHGLNAYGLRFRYIVNHYADNADKTQNKGQSASYFGLVCPSLPCFEKETPPTANVDGLGNYRIAESSASGARVLANHVPLVVISLGQNGCNDVVGYEAHNCSPNGHVIVAAADQNNTFYQAQPSRNQFDDLLMWVSSFEIKHYAGTLNP
ncbi:type II secretion system protein [Thiomicrospira sp. R3]|uniref:type II secretion system protein n=1 Tax=Thiomicrospira sp. R3 TaxID=3035472 RepID=UPI00259B8AB4|nr:type II secretion system protein [Thiomicrospira sp. R3]WFE68684.1 type II secretion system protein [Thiomicrospira sp. R3]